MKYIALIVMRLALFPKSEKCMLNTGNCLPTITITITNVVHLALKSGENQKKSFPTKI